jgi:hypothetical protein
MNLSLANPLREKTTLRVLDAGDDLLQVQCSRGVHVTFHLSGVLAGTVANMSVEGVPVLTGGPTPCFWRAPTDNDRGGEGISYCARWRNAGIDRLQTVRFPWKFHSLSTNTNEAIKSRVSSLPFRSVSLTFMLTQVLDFFGSLLKG